MSFISVLLRPFQAPVSFKHRGKDIAASGASKLAEGGAIGNPTPILLGIAFLRMDMTLS